MNLIAYGTALLIAFIIGLSVGAIGIADNNRFLLVVSAVLLIVSGCLLVIH